MSNTIFNFTVKKFNEAIDKDISESEGEYANTIEYVSKRIFKIKNKSNLIIMRHEKKWNIHNDKTFVEFAECSKKTLKAIKGGLKTYEIVGEEEEKAIDHDNKFINIFDDEPINHTEEELFEEEEEPEEKRSSYTFEYPNENAIKKIDISNDENCYIFKSEKVIELIEEAKEDYNKRMKKYLEKNMIHQFKKQLLDDHIAKGSPVPTIDYSKAMTYMLLRVMKIRNNNKYIIKNHDGSYEIYENKTKFEESITHKLAEHSRQFVSLFRKYIKEFIIDFNPESNIRIDRRKQIINMYEPAKYINSKVAPNNDFVELFQKLTMILANNNPQKASVIEKFCASIAQGKKNDIALCISGTQGTGKSSISKLMEHILGNGMTTIMNVNSLMRFNSLAKNKLFCYIDETSTEDIGQQKVASENLKSLISNDCFGFESKGKDVKMEKAYASWIISSNNPIYFDFNGGRRYLSLTPSEEMKIKVADKQEVKNEKKKYWARINGTNEGDMVAITQHLLGIDLSDFHGQIEVGNIVAENDVHENQLNLKPVHQYLLNEYVLKQISKVVDTKSFSDAFIAWKQKEGIKCGTEAIKLIYKDAMEVGVFYSDKRTGNKKWLEINHEKIAAYLTENG